MAIAASGCGSDSLPDPVASAVAATRATDGAKVQMKIGFQGGGAPQGIEMKADGVADMKAGEMQMTLDLGGLGAALGNGASKVDPADLKTELRLVDKTLYMQMGVLQKQLPKGKKWLELDAEKIGQSLGIDVSQLSQYNDPTKMLDYLRSTGKVEEVGSEDVRGVGTKHYRATVDIAKAAKRPRRHGQGLRRRARPARQVPRRQQGAGRRLHRRRQARAPDDDAPRRPAAAPPPAASR